jgi:hypothetical protein
VTDEGDLFRLNEQARKMTEYVREALSPQLEGMQRAIDESVAPMLERQRQAIEQSVAPLVRAHADAMNAWVESNHGVIESMLRAAEQFREAWQEAIPPNIRDLDADSLFKALEMSIADGPCVIWAPRVEITERLVAADTFADRAAVLIECRNDVLSDMTAVLAEATCEVVPAQGDARELATRAVEAARDGHDVAAQALAAATLACVLQEVLPYGGLGAAYKQMAAHDIEQAHFWIVGRVTIEVATSRALTDTDKHVAGFNRHGTLHGKLSFYGPGEMIAGLLLVVAWVRELSSLAEHDPSVLLGRGEANAGR